MTKNFNQIIILFHEFPYAKLIFYVCFFINLRLYFIKKKTYFYNLRYISYFYYKYLVLSYSSFFY